MYWLKKNKLFLNTLKTNIMLIGTNCKLRNANENDFYVVIHKEDLESIYNV